MSGLSSQYSHMYIRIGRSLELTGKALLGLLNSIIIYNAQPSFLKKCQLENTKYYVVGNRRIVNQLNLFLIHIRSNIPLSTYTNLFWLENNYKSVNSVLIFYATGRAKISKIKIKYNWSIV